jgi:hypothetical protein
VFEVFRKGKGMATERLTFIQIIYEESQRQHCYPFATVYKNEKLTPWFENDVIMRIIGGGEGRISETIQGEYIGICSWRLAHKRRDMYRLQDKNLTRKKIEDADFDVAILTPRSSSHKPLHMASHWHGEAWDKAFKFFVDKFMNAELGVYVPEELSNAIYENHFIAYWDIYKDYVGTYLKPAIEFMNANPIFMTSAGYMRRKSPEDQKHIIPILQSWGLSDYPIGVFILERLFSIYCEGKGFKIINL